MSRVDQGSLAVLAMTSRFTDSGAPPLKASEVWRLLERVDDPSTLLGLDERAAGDLTPGTGVEPARLVQLLAQGIGLAMRLETLDERGITAITLFDQPYPWRLRDRLGLAAPPVLYCAGELSLLAVDGIGIVGSRDVGPDAAEYTRKVAQQVAGAGLSVVSGGAKGVDSIAMAAAYDAGGQAIGVLSDSLERAIGQADNRRAMLDGRACLCTPYRPDARFTTGSAMGRNKVIYGLSGVTLVVTSTDGEGGTWSGATEAIRKGYGRVAVWMGAGRGPGNDALVKAGGAPIEQPEAILEVDAIQPKRPADKRQMTLAFDLAQTRGESTRPSVTEHERSDPSTAPRRFPLGALVPEATGICWCGCGQAVEAGAFFRPRHAPGAAQRAVVKHFGSVELFLAMLGEAPDTGPT